MSSTNTDMKQESIVTAAIEAVCRRIAPMWPLKNFVAVNPYMGYSDMPFSEAAHLLSKRGGVTMTLPLRFYSRLLDEGRITAEDISEALVTQDMDLDVSEFLSLTEEVKVAHTKKKKTATFIDFIDREFSQDIKDLKIEVISTWASSFFDQGQASWGTENATNDLFSRWKSEALVDRTPELRGLKGFRDALCDLPSSPVEAVHLVVECLDIPDECIEEFLHAELLRLSGWASYIAGVDWNNRLYASETKLIEEFLAILVSWEYAVFKSLGSSQLHTEWLNEFEHHETGLHKDMLSLLDCELILQDAFDIAHQRELNMKLSQHKPSGETPVEVEAQAAFCIDVRSEVIRRNLEYVDPTIETIGFAGFFGVPVKFKPIGDSNGKHQCPVLIPSKVEVKESYRDPDILSRNILRSRVSSQFHSGVKRFKSWAGSSFGYVSPLGLLYLPKLIGNTIKPKASRIAKGANEMKWAEDGKCLDLSGIVLNDKIEIAASTLRAMGLQDRFARIIFLIGHGSKSVNNPHSSGLECGACGGHSGEINALAAVEILNDANVRKGLEKHGIDVPIDTLFVAGLHNTISDEITLLGKEGLNKEYEEQLNKYRVSFSRASKISRLERSRRFAFDDRISADELMWRGEDWSQVRPEWGLAGCSSFIVAPRAHTKHVNLQGRSFLHNYDWKSDEEFKTLESILTAPMVVTSWINLQYYASVVDNQNFGAGNKTLHNVTGGIGVVEGLGGDLRSGLPMQSIHDGSDYQHLPNRLSVIVDAPIDAINEILTKHPEVQALFDNGWIYLFNLDKTGKMAHKYVKQLSWKQIELHEYSTVEE